MQPVLPEIVMAHSKPLGLVSLQAEGQSLLLYNHLPLSVLTLHGTNPGVKGCTSYKNAASLARGRTGHK